LFNVELSLGRGFGVNERVLRRCDYYQPNHGVNVAEGGIEGARKAAEEEGLGDLTYEVADLNTANLPTETYDAFYLHAALHHVFQHEHLLDQIKQTLKPGGLFVVYEYIGPSQIQFPRRDLELSDVFLNAFQGVTEACEDTKLVKNVSELQIGVQALKRTSLACA
jgi:SAM-dependent methyltransferase